VAGDLASMAAALGVIVYFLASNPEVQDALRAEPGRIAAAIDEMLRIVHPLLVSRRIATVGIRTAGFLLQTGTRIYLNWTSANRDETVFGDPVPTSLKDTRRITWFMVPESMFARVVPWQRWS
jgi:cytochrome P450